MKTPILDNLITADPKLYKVERHWWIYWAVKRIDDNTLVRLFFWKGPAQLKCDHLNMCYSFGYSVGVKVMMDYMKNPEFSIEEI